MGRMNGKLVLAASLIFVAGCQSTNPLEERIGVPRANLGLQALPNPGPEQVTDTTSTAPPATTTRPVVEEERITGTYDFAVPATVTRVKRSTNTFEQYSLYNGRPKPTDTPFVVITVGPDLKPLSGDLSSEFRVQDTRTYSLNGLATEEYKGYTAANQPFCELIVSHGKGDKLRAVAVARTEEERKLALDILGSIKWKAAAQP